MKLVAIDPSGGPMLGIGYQLKLGKLTLELVEIEDFKLKFKLKCQRQRNYLIGKYTMDKNFIDIIYDSG